MKILVPVDRSHRDGIVLDYVVQLAKALGAGIALVHAVPLTRSLIPHAVRESEAYVTAVAAGVSEQGLTPECIIRRGDPAAVIVTVGIELEVDLIVMATRGRNALGRLIMGSVASRVLTSCEEPVLLLSEAVSVAASHEDLRLEAEYIGTVVRHMELRGLCTKQEADTVLGRLATSGLDLTALVASYQAAEQREALFSELDLAFQLDTLRKFFADDAVTWIREELLGIPDVLAA